MNSITFSTNNYNQSYENSLTSMWKDIGSLLRLLTSQRYIAVVKENTANIIVIEYDLDNSTEDLGVENPHWITEDEFDGILIQREIIDQG